MRFLQAIDDETCYLLSETSRIRPICRWQLLYMLISLYMSMHFSLLSISIYVYKQRSKKDLSPGNGYGSEKDFAVK